MKDTSVELTESKSAPNFISFILVNTSEILKYHIVHGVTDNLGARDSQTVGFITYNTNYGECPVSESLNN